MALPLKNRRLVFFLVAFLLLGSLFGCVRRRLTIRSNPPGAYVYVDDYEVGTTPVSHNFIYYGERKIRLVKDGFETLTVMQSIPMPWYQIPPLDFVSENLVPGEIRDHRTITYQLTPQCVVPRDQLLGRAENLRHQVQGPRSVPLPPVSVPPVSVPLESVPPGSLPPPVLNQLPGAGTPTPPAWNTVPPAANPATNPGSIPSSPPVGFGPRSTSAATQPVAPVQPGYSQPIYTQPEMGGRFVQPLSPGPTGQ